MGSTPVKSRCSTDLSVFYFTTELSLSLTLDEDSFRWRNWQFTVPWELPHGTGCPLRHGAAPLSFVLRALGFRNMFCEKNLTRLTLSLYGHWGLNHLILPWTPPQGIPGPLSLRDVNMDMHITDMTFSKITELDILIGENFCGLGSVLGAAKRLVHLRICSSCSGINIPNQIPKTMQWPKLERLEFVGIKCQESTMIQRFQTLAPRLKVTGISFIKCKSP